MLGSLRKRLKLEREVDVLFSVFGLSVLAEISPFSPFLVL